MEGGVGRGGKRKRKIISCRGVCIGERENSEGLRVRVGQRSGEVW